MNSAKERCRCCYTSEAVETICGPALNVYKLICNIEGLEDDSRTAICRQCCEFLKKVHCFIFDDVFLEELNDKHDEVESVFKYAVDEESSQLRIKKEVIDEYNEVDQIDVEVDIDLKSPQTCPESLLVSDIVKREPSDGSFDPVENNYLVELYDVKEYDGDQQLQFKKKGKRNSFIAENEYSCKAAKQLYSTLINVHYNEVPLDCGEDNIKFNYHHSITNPKRKLKISLERCDKKINENTHNVAGSKNENDSEKSANFNIDSDKRFKCSECPHQTKTKRNLKAHIARMHSDDKPFNCDRCNYSSKTKYQLSVHKRIHLDDSEYPYKCNECSYKTITGGQLKKHIARRHSDDKPFSCDHCNYSTKTKADLKSHEKIHLGDTAKVYSCTQCSYKTITKSSLRSHIICKHSDDKPFSCDRCNYSTKTSNQLWRHTRIHLDDTAKAYECNECSYKTISKCNLRSHIAHRHSDDKPFSCDHCNFSTKTKNRLSRHKRLHLDETGNPTNAKNTHTEQIRVKVRRHSAHRHCYVKKVSISKDGVL